MSLRSLSHRALATVIVVPIVAIVGGVAAARQNTGSGSPPPPKALPTAIHDALTATPVAGVTARIRFTNHLVASGALPGSGSPLLNGATGRLWASKDGVRLELQNSSGGDTQIVWHAGVLTVYDASSKTVYRFARTGKDATTRPDASKVPPSVVQIQSALARLGSLATLSGATPTTQGGEPAYSVRVAPSHDGGLLGAVRLVWDSQHGIPLRASIYAQGTSAPVLDLAVTHITFGSVPDSDIAITPPTGVKVVDLSSLASRAKADHSTDSASGAPPTTPAPATLVGLPRVQERTVDWAGSPARVLVYGHGLGALVIVARKADTTAGQKDPLGALPAISIAGASGHELPTALGTILSIRRSGVQYLVLGSLPPSAAEAAARELFS